MESGNGSASSKGVLVPVSTTSDAFQNNILAPLKSAYLYEESKQCFRYKSAVIIKNPALEKKYNAFRTKRREAGYSEEDLKESYGFLLFDDVNKANAIGETGVLTGNSTCTTLGDPSKGVYIPMYSDCLDLNRWYHGKSGYIAIIRLTKGRVKKVLENYTQNFIEPTEGFDCHVSEQLPSVSAKTSSFLAFERTQYYMYELLDDGSSETAQSPSTACPFAIVSFSYTDTKATLEAPQEKSEEKKLVCHYFPWRGQLQIGTHFYDVGLRSTAGALIPAELPPVVKVDRAISMLVLRQLLPRAVFETCFSGEVFLDGFYCSLFELVSSEVEQTSSLATLLLEIKERDVALPIPLNDGGFLILLHSSHFLPFDDTGSSAIEVLQGIFVFPDSRVIQRDTKFGPRKPAMSSEILRVLPVLSYAEGEAEKTSIDPSGELCEVFVQHMQNYASLINPGLASSPSRDLSIFPEQYDVPDAHRHLYSSTEWTNRAWQNFSSYLSKPVSFQLPVSMASEILVAGQEERIEDLDDDVYFCLSSPEEAPASLVSSGSDDQLIGQKSAVNFETALDSCITTAEPQDGLTAVPQNVVPDDWQPEDTTKDTEKSDLTLLIKTDDMGAKNLLTPSTSDDLPAELIVSITSAERTVTNASLSVNSTESATKHNDFQLSGFSTAKFQTTGVSSLDDGTVPTKKIFEYPEFTNDTKTKSRKLQRGHSKSRKHVSKACVETRSLQKVKIPVEDDMLNQKEDQAKDSLDRPELSNPSNIDWRKVGRQKRKSKKVRSFTVGLAVAKEKKPGPGQQSFGSTILMELDACPLRKKTERWDLKPVISECGRILVPHGSVEIADQIKALKDKVQSRKDETCPEKMLVDSSVNAHDTVEMEQEANTAVETTEATTSKVGGNHPQKISQVNSEHSILRKLDEGNGSLTLNPESNEHSSKNNGTDTPPLKEVKEKHTDTSSSETFATKGELLLNKLKSVLLRGKRKAGIPESEKTTGTTQETEPGLKKGKADSYSGILKNNDAITSVQDTNLGVNKVSKMLSVDPLFAYALGLTPKETPDKMHKSEDQDTQERKESSETQEQTVLNKQPQIIQRPLSIFTRRGRIKTLKKHQGISAEHVKKKWWLHFQTPASFASEKHKYKECISDNSVRKTVKEKSNTACSPTDALNLLADLALSASKDQIPPQPDPALEREPETSLKKCDLTKDVTSAEQESVLLRQPTAKPIQLLESPSPSHLVGGSELVGLISKEHAYSLPPSSSVLLDLSGTPFQVSPLSGSTRLLHHHQAVYGNGIKTLHPSVDQEDRSEHNHRTPENLKRHVVRRRKFRHSRTFVNKDGSAQVTREWKENYDFNLDSKFTNDSKYRAIIRALHGPWDFSIQDTSEEVRLIFHMWIGLFYSRSTTRFFHLDSNCTNPCSEESDSLEMPSGMVSAPASCQSVTDTSDTLISNALDLSKKDNSVLDQGTVILDLSLRNSNAEMVTSDLQVNREETAVSGEQKDANETLNTLESGLQNASTFQCYRNSVHSTEMINAMNHVSSTFESKRASTPLQKAGCLEHTDVPSFKEDGTFISVQEEMDSVSLQENYQTSSRTGHVLHGYNSEKTHVKDGIENSEAAKTRLVQKQGRDSFKSVMDKEVHCNKNAGNMVHTTEQDETESNDVKNWVHFPVFQEKSYGEDDVELYPKMVQTGNDSTNEESSIVCNGNLLENEKQLSSEEPKAVSPDKAENVKDGGCYAVHEDKVTEDEHFGKEDGLDDKDCSILAVEADNDLNDQSMPMKCDGSDSLKKNCFTDCNQQAPLEEQPPQADNEADACRDIQLRKLCANGSALTDEHSISEKAPHTPSEKEPIDKEFAVDENFDNGICLSDLHDQPLSVCDDTDSKKDCITECKGQAPLDELLPQEDNEEDACNDIQLRKLCANGSALTDEHSISEKAPHSPSEKEPIDKESAVDENFDNGICLSDLHDQPLSVCDDTDSKKDCITECKDQAPLDELLPQEDNEEDACNDIQLRKLCANGSALTDEHSISEKAPHSPSEKEPIDKESAVEENSKTDDDDVCDDTDSKRNCITSLHFRKLCPHGNALTDEPGLSEKADYAPSELKPNNNELVIEENSEDYICLLDNALNQKALPLSEKTCSLDWSVHKSIPLTNDRVETESQNKVMANFGLSSDDCEDQDTKLFEGEQNVDSTIQKALSYHQSHSPQYEAVTRCESELALTKETDLKSDKTNMGSEKIDGRVVIPFIGIDTSGEDAVQPHDSHSEGMVEEVQGQKEISFMNESTYPETIPPTEVCSTSKMHIIKAELSAGKISSSLLNESKTDQPDFSGSESDNRCPTPTMDEEPYQYVTCYGPSTSNSSSFSGSKTYKNTTQKSLSRSSTSMKDEMPLERKHKSTVNSDPNPQHNHHHPDLELRTIRVLQTIDKFLSNSSHTGKSSRIKPSDMKLSLDQTDKGKKTSIGQDYCHTHRSFPSTECLQAFTPNIDQDGHKTKSQTNISHELRSCSQRPVMAVKPSKSDEIQADCISKDIEVESSVMSNFSKTTKSPAVTYTPTTPASTLLEKKTEHLNQEAIKQWLSNVGDSKSLPLCQHEGRDLSKFNKIPSSSLLVQSLESAKTSPEPLDGKQSFLTNSLLEKVGKTAKENIEMYHKDYSHASTSAADYKDHSIRDDSLFLAPQSSLTCTVFNTSQMRSESFLEQLSQRCLQDDLTQASMEQECLIFSEQMKQLLKRSKKGPIHQQDAYENLNLSCSSPMTVHFSTLEEQEDSVDHLEAPSLVGQKIKVEMSDRKDLADTTEEENILHPQKLSQGTGNPKEHAGVSSVTAECARLYTAMMNDVCAVKKVPTRSKHLRRERGYPKTEPSNHFDFCEQIKRERDESFCSNLKSVVKKSCKMKYRFYILVTSDDAFFEETKAQLEAEGHTAVQPSEFFLVEDRSSLLIILRNEDIAEHICEVPHLLKLKKSPGVQFAGIDEPDDVVNLTQQELLIRGGFVMFDRATMESLSLCNMKKMSEILQELSRTGKWKWMLHYRDSRRLKENARFNTEAKEKKNFLNWCEEAGILEVLPYHECDLMSRDQPDYLTCLVRLQVQNISARYPVFITDTTTDSSFGTNGILTMTFSSILTCSLSETFTV